MPFIPVPGSVQGTISYLSNDGTFAMNRVYFAAEEVPTVTDLEEIADALYDVLVAQYPDMCSDQWQVTGIHLRAMNEEEGIQMDSTGTFPIVGTVGTVTEMPNQVSYTVTLSTGLVGRSARGRLYGVGLAPSFQNGIRVTDAGRNILQLGWNQIRNAMEVSGHAMQVVSFVDGGVPRTEGRPLPVLSVNVRFPLATQRSRLT